MACANAVIHFFAIMQLLVALEVVQIDFTMQVPTTFISANLTPHTKGYMETEQYNKDQPAYLVLGITAKCLVYFQWLNRWKGDSKALQETVYYEADGSRCDDIQPFFIRTEVTQTELLIGVRRIGRRMVVQSLVNSACLAKEKKKRFHAEVQTFTCRFYPNVRHFQFLSQEFPSGFKYLGTTKLFGRLIVYGHTETQIMLLMLKIGQSNADYGPGGHDTILLPHLQLLATIEVTDLEPSSNMLLIEPHESQQDKDFLWFKLLRGLPHNRSAGTMYEIYLPPAMHGRTIFRSQYSYGEEYVMVYSDEHMIARKIKFEMGQFTIRKVNFKKRDGTEKWKADDLPPVTAYLRGATIRTWINPYRFHRRMAYPHAVHRVKRTRVFDGWKIFIPVIIVNLIIFLALLALSSWLISHHQNILRRMGLSASRSTLTR
ncbi:hypothetical protein V3C99_000452 [Haemonchus contortus]